jgi:xanthine dehydrogenase large subunit
MTAVALTGPELLVRGAAQFTADLPLPAGALHGAVAVSPLAHARWSRLECTAAAASRGVLAVLTAADIPGVNQVGDVVADEPLLADREATCVGQPICLVLADAAEAAWRAAQLVGADWVELPAVLDAHEARAAGRLLGPPRTFAAGDVDAAWPRCALVVEGHVELGGQEHAALETHAALAVPRDDGGLLVHAATQSPSATQRAVAAVTGLPMHLVEVQVTRLGGGFGGKETQATTWACLAALGALHSARAVRVAPDRRDDMRITGKRHPYLGTYRLGLDAEGRFQAYEVTLLQDAGRTTDLSPAVLERSLFHACSAYAIPNVRITVMSCRTNLPSNTAFRGFGAPQAIATIEAGIRTAARAMGVRPTVLQRANLVTEGDVTHYGMRLVDVRARECWDALVARFDPDRLAADALAWNAQHPLVRRGVDVIPLCFGIAFTAQALNQAEALVHVYVDGTVSVTTGAVDMGQGVGAKLRAAVAHELGAPVELVRVEPTTTSRVANVSPTAASTGADLNGAAATQAARVVRAGLEKVDPGGELAWRQRVALAYEARVGLSALAHYATPGLDFDAGSHRGRPFAYHVYGAAVVTSTVDVLRGTAQVDRVAVVHDIGRSIDRLVDLGQVEGAVVQGVGWLTCEEVRHDGRGRLLTDSLATYKIPDLASAPEVEVVLLEREAPGLLGSKAVGEPPLVYGIGALFAIRDAIRSARPDLPDDVRAPLTPEQVFLALHGPLPAAPDADVPGGGGSGRADG